MKVDVQGIDDMENCECPVDERWCFFAYLHGIDSKDAVMSTTFDRLVEIVNDAIERSAEMNGSLMTFLTDKGAWVASLNSDVRIRIVSDSIYLWTKCSEWSTQFDSLLHLVSNVLVAGFVHALPLRGVVSYGKLKFDGGEILDDMSTGVLHVDPAPYGSQLSEARELSSLVDLSGVVLSPNVEIALRREFVAGKIKSTAMIRGPWDILKNSPYLFVGYSVQIGDEIESRVVVNWNYDRSRELPQTKIKEAFDGACRVCGNSAKFMRRETLQFYDYTQSIKSSKT